MDMQTFGALLAYVKKMPDTAVSRAETVLESIPEEYSELSADVEELKSAETTAELISGDNYRIVIGH